MDNYFVTTVTLSTILFPQVKLYPDCPEPPSFASELDDHIKQHNSKAANKNNLKTAENIDKFGIPGGPVPSSYEVKQAKEKITKEAVDDIVVVLRACGYGLGDSEIDHDKAKSLTDKFRSQVSENICDLE